LHDSGPKIGLIAAVGVTAANTPEPSVAEPLKADLEAQKITLKELHIVA
jgi:hypothetical protein